MRDLAIGWPLPRISAARMGSIKQLLISPPHTPIRMNATSLASRRRQMLATFRYNGDYERLGVAMRPELVVIRPEPVEGP